ncbi:MAG TPA: hypothetical protein VGH36_07050 [Acetobacteraceae bacterium]|jgi:hypothetical protein
MSDIMAYFSDEDAGRGARPVHGSWDAPSGWVIAEGYGETPEKIIEGVIDRWLLWGGGDPDIGTLWCATLGLYETPEDRRPEPPPATLRGQDLAPFPDR